MAGVQDSNLEDENQDDQDGKTEANDKSSTGSEKKQKTPEQIERERMRRRRRRQRQRIMRSLEMKPGAEKKDGQKQVETSQQLDKLKQERERLQNEQKKNGDEKIKLEMKPDETEKTDTDLKDKVEKPDDVVASKKIEMPARGQQLREETHPRILDGNKPPDMRFDKPAQNDVGLDNTEQNANKAEEEKIEQDRMKKQEEEKQVVDLKKKEKERLELKKKQEKEKLERAEKKEREQKDLAEKKRVEETEKKLNEEKQKIDLEEAALKQEQADVQKSDLAEKVQQQKDTEQIMKMKEEEKSDAFAEKEDLKKQKKEQKIEEVKAEDAKKAEKLDDEKGEKLDLESEKETQKTEAELDEEVGDKQPTPIYHAEPEYTTNSFAFEQPQEKPLSKGIQAEPEIDAQPVDVDSKPTDEALTNELMDSDSGEKTDLQPDVENEVVNAQPEAGEELIDVSEPVVEAEPEPLAEEAKEDSEPIDLAGDENPDDDTLVPADSVVNEVPIFAEQENVDLDLSDDLTFGDSKENHDVPSIPIGKMREDHSGSSPDMNLPYENIPTSEREVSSVESPNVLNENVEPESQEATDDTSETPEKKEVTNVAEELNEKKAPAVDFAMKLAKMVSEFAQKIIPVVGGGFGNVAKFLKDVFGKLNIRMVGGLVGVLLIAVFGYFGFTQKWHEQAWGAVSGTVGSFFKPKAEEPKIEVKPRIDDQRRFGITTALLFAGNNGAHTDRVTADIFMALYYGSLAEPRVLGETGISAATFYGELKDLADFVNVYVEYVDNLEHMQSLYKTDVYKLLDQTTKRDEVLLKHLDELKAMKEKGLRIQEQIGINLDDLKVSFESLNGEKNKGETDFFAALSDLQGQKSDTLLKQFIEVSQKQVALKARIAALSKLQAYYVTALARLDKRLEAIDKNRDPLIQGIRVVDVPGSDLDLIIREQ